MHRYLITKADGNTISMYKDFLTTGGSYNIVKRKHNRFVQLFLFSKKHRPLIKKITQKPLSVSSRRRHLSAVKNFFEFLKQSYEDNSSYFQKNPVKSKIHAVKLKDQDVDSTKLLTKSDWEKLNSTIIRAKERLMIHLLYFGGLRLSELAKLEVSNFNRENGTITFIRKGGDIHRLKIQNEIEIFDLFTTYLNGRKKDSIYLFPGKFANRAITSKAIYNHLMKLFLISDCDKNLTPHSFRKACATNLYIDTNNLLLVRNYLNHKDAKVTQTYIEI